MYKRIVVPVFLAVDNYIVIMGKKTVGLDNDLFIISCEKFVIFNLKSALLKHVLHRERSGSVVECLTRDRDTFILA